MNALKVPCLLNTALCYTKINRYPQAVENCNKVGPFSLSLVC